MQHFQNVAFKSTLDLKKKTKRSKLHFKKVKRGLQRSPLLTFPLLKCEEGDIKAIRKLKYKRKQLLNMFMMSFRNYE